MPPRDRENGNPADTSPADTSPADTSPADTSPADTNRYRQEKGLPGSIDIPGYREGNDSKPQSADGTDIPRYRDDGKPETPSSIDIPRYRDDAKPEAPSSIDIPGYPSAAESASAADSNRYPLFAETAFESIDDYIDYIEELERERKGLPPLFPDRLRQVPPCDGLGSRQVGLRLPEADFRRLRELGDTYGVTPATLARMIVVRAVRSIRRDQPD
jgi:hypothetical protein